MAAGAATVASAFRVHSACPAERTLGGDVHDGVQQPVGGVHARPHDFGGEAPRVSRLINGGEKEWSDEGVRAPRPPPPPRTQLFDSTASPSMPKRSAMAVMRSGRKVPSESMYAALPSPPPSDLGICAVTHSVWHICVLPVRNSPAREGVSGVRAVEQRSDGGDALRRTIQLRHGVRLHAAAQHVVHGGSAGGELDHRAALRGHGGKKGGSHHAALERTRAPRHVPSASPPRR